MNKEIEIEGMDCCIYKIINTKNSKVYVGSTTQLPMRLKSHLNRLERNTHTNKPLQKDWNSYGRAAFRIEVNFTKEFGDALYEKEVEVIKENRDNCYNQIIVDVANYTKYPKPTKQVEDTKCTDITEEEKELLEKEISSEERYFEIYLGYKKYPHPYAAVGRVYHLDGKTISSMVQDKSYYLERLKIERLTEEEKENFVKAFKIKMEKSKKNTRVEKAVINKAADKETIIDFLCVVTAYGRGSETIFLKKNDMSRGLKNQIQRGAHKDAYELYLQLPIEKIVERGINYFEINSLQELSNVEIKLNNNPTHLPLIK